MARSISLSELEARIDYHFENRDLLDEATTHSTLLNEAAGRNRRDNRRLAHLGDAVVELVVRAHLFSALPHATKEQLTDAKRQYVEDSGLAARAEALGVGPAVERGGSRPESQDNETVRAEAFEALMGAIFLDAGYAKAAPVVARLVGLTSPYEGAGGSSSNLGPAQI